MISSPRPKCLVADGMLIGDSVLLRPLVKALLNSGRDVYYMGGSHIDQIFEDMPLQKLYCQWPWGSYDYSLKSWFAIFRFLVNCFVMGFDLVIEPRGDIRAISMLYFTCPKTLAGFSFSKGETLLDIKVPEDQRIFHLDDYNQALARMLNLAYDRRDIRLNQVPLKQAKHTKSGFRIGISFSGSKPLKCMTTELAGTLFDELALRECELIYISSPDDLFIKNNPCFLDSYPVSRFEGNFNDYYRLLKSLDGYIGMDSAGGHIASMLNIPEIIFFSTASSAYAHPISDKCIPVEIEQKLECKFCDGVHCDNRKKKYCLTGITRDQIKAACDRFICWMASI